MTPRAPGAVQLVRAAADGAAARCPASGPGTGRVAACSGPSREKGAAATGLQAAALERVARSALRALIGRWRGGAVPDLPGDAFLGEAGIGLDSLEMLEAVADLNRRFGLSVTGVEDHLLVNRRLCDWGRLIEAHFDLVGDAAELTFSTSGSTGAPKEIDHRLPGLLAEVDALGGALWPDAADAPSRVLALVPAHHIFGFLLTVLLPGRLGVEVVDLSGKGPGALGRLGRPGDLVVATPHLLSLALNTMKPTGGLTAIVSGASTPDALWQMASDREVALIEIYGATETAGVGYRRSPHAGFALMPHLDRAGPGIFAAGRGQLDVQDRLRWLGPRSFVLEGRKDNVVQVAGVNVSPQATGRHLERTDGVAAATVRLDTQSGRLKAFVIAKPGKDEAVLEVALRMGAEALPAAARPARYTFGLRLPTTPAGKLSDW
ncbi:MAG: AMP-binding protein [Pseudomonadota bacterium]